MIIEVFIEKLFDKFSTYSWFKKNPLSLQHGWEFPWPNEDTRNWFISHFLMKQTFVKSGTRMSFPVPLLFLFSVLFLFSIQQKNGV